MNVNFQMRWVLRWYWGILPYRVLQYRNLVEYVDYRNTSHPLFGAAPTRKRHSWSDWQDVKDSKED